MTYSATIEKLVAVLDLIQWLWHVIEWLTDIFSEHVFELFGLETTLNNQLVITTNGTSGTQLSQDES